MGKETDSGRAVYLIWVAFWVLIAFGLRAFRLDLQSLWYDEGVTVDIARRTLLDLTRWTAQDIQPPLYYYVVSGWGKLLQALSFGAPELLALPSEQQSIPNLWGGAWSEWSVRFVSVFFGTLTVPLMAGLAVRLTRQRMAGVIAVMLTAIHPLLFYYSQEARMYAMLTFLGVLAGYVLFGEYRKEGERVGVGVGVGVRTGGGDGTRWALYIVVATAAIYTHYFAFFLLGTLGLGYLLKGSGDEGKVQVRKKAPTRTEQNRSRTGFKERLGALVSAHITILILYIPWFTTLFYQLSGDSSYWQGEFKLGEAARKVAISFVGGETVTEEIGLWLLIPMGLLTVIATMALAWPRRVVGSKQLSVNSKQLGVNNKQSTLGSNQLPTTIHYPLATLLLWWLFPALCILLLALFIPKFNPRYVIVGLPGLILLWSAGLSRMAVGSVKISPPSGMPNAANLHTSDNPQNQLTNHEPRFTNFDINLVPFFQIAALLLIALSTFAYADRNYFIDPEYTKTQWRPLARYVRKRIPPEDVVVLTSGHAWPIWNYYAPLVPAVSLPRLRILDVNNVLDYPTAASLMGNALAEKQGAWLVSWQDDVVDPTGVVPLLLERAGSEVPSERDYWDISLRRFEELDPSRLQLHVGNPVTVNYGTQLILRGFDVHTTDELLLYWQRHPDYEPPQGEFDLRLTGQLRTPEELVYAFFDDQPLTVEDWPSNRWRLEQLVVSRVPATVWAGTGAMPGAYGLQLGLYDPAGDLGGYDILSLDGEPMGKTRTLPLHLKQPTQGPPAQDSEFPIKLHSSLYGAFDVTQREANHDTQHPVS